MPLTVIIVALSLAVVSPQASNLAHDARALCPVSAVAVADAPASCRVERFTQAMDRLNRRVGALAHRLETILWKVQQAQRRQCLPQTREPWELP